MKSISVLIVLRICFVLWGIVYNLSKCWTCWGHSWPACVHQYNLMLPSNSALWFMKQNRNYIKTGKTFFFIKKIRRRSGAVSFLLFGSGCVILKTIPSGIISIACSLSFLVHVRHPWGSMLYLAHHSWRLLSAPLGCSVSIVTSQAVAFSLSQWPLSSLDAALLGPGIQPALAAHLVLSSRTVSSLCVVASSSRLSKPRPVIREDSLAGHRCTGFAYG